MISRGILRINEFRADVHLGCTSEEQNHLQEVRVSVSLKFSKIPLATESDQIEDTICYAQLTEELRSICSRKKYSTIERLTKNCYDSIKSLVPENTGIRITLHKIKPPIDLLLGGACFELENDQWG